MDNSLVEPLEVLANSSFRLIDLDVTYLRAVKDELGIVYISPSEHNDDLKWIIDNSHLNKYQKLTDMKVNELCASFGVANTPYLFKVYHQSFEDPSIPKAWSQFSFEEYSSKRKELNR